MACSLAAYHASLLTAIDLEADRDAVRTLDHIRDEYPDEFHRICQTITNTIREIRP